MTVKALKKRFKEVQKINEIFGLKKDASTESDLYIDFGFILGVYFYDKKEGKKGGRKWLAVK